MSKKRRDEAIAKGEVNTGEESFNFFMAIHYPESQLKILDYNRVLKSLNGMTGEQFLERVNDCYDIKPKGEGEDLKPSCKFESSLYIDKKWFSIKVKENRIDASSPVKTLDS